MVAAGTPTSTPSRKPAGSTVAKQVASASPGFQPSAAAQSTASAISCGCNVLMLKLDSNLAYPGCEDCCMATLAFVDSRRALTLFFLPDYPPHLKCSQTSFPPWQP